MSEVVKLVSEREYFAEQSAETPPEVVTRLARLSPFEYDRVRDTEAKMLGIRVGTLDVEVKKLRLNDNEDCAVFLEDPEPWPEPVDGDALLDRLTNTAKAHLVAPSGAADAIALWVVFAHAHDCFHISPILATTSPTPECGKTTLLTFLGGVVPRPLPASNITAAALFRAVEKWRPTVLIDEADTYLRDSDELRGVLNSGHQRANAFVIRTSGDDHEPTRFHTWAPKAVAMIGKLPPTLASRAVHIELRRKTADEYVEALRLDRLGHLEPLLRMAARWATDNAAALREADPEMPSGLYGRAADNWRPLLAIADAAGGNWPEQARRVADKLSQARTEQVAGIMLLEDMQNIFAQRRDDEIASAELVEILGAMEDRPWVEWKAGRPITPRQVAKLLEPFGIRPKNIRTGARVPKGYALPDFDDAFRCYLPSRSATPLHPYENRDFLGSQSATAKVHVADSEGRKWQKSAACSGVADENPLESPFGDGDPFASLKDGSLKLKQASRDDYPDLPGFLDRRAARGS